MVTGGAEESMRYFPSSIMLADDTQILAVSHYLDS